MCYRIVSEEVILCDWMVWRSCKGNHVLDLHLKEWGGFYKQKEEQQSSPRNNILKVIVMVLDFDYLFQDDNTLNMIEFYSSWKDEVEDEFPFGPFQEIIWNTAGECTDFCRQQETPEYTWDYEWHMTWSNLWFRGKKISQ